VITLGRREEVDLYRWLTLPTGSYIVGRSFSLSSEVRTMTVDLQEQVLLATLHISCTLLCLWSTVEGRA
jgi:hypothetical protein